MLSINSSWKLVRRGSIMRTIYQDAFIQVEDGGNFPVDSALRFARRRHPDALDVGDAAPVPELFQ